MAKKFEYGENVYLPVTITNTEPDHGYDYKVSFNDFVDDAQCSVAVGESQIKTAEEIAGPFKTKADAMTVTADSLQKENEELEKKNLELENENGKLAVKVNSLEAECEQYRQSNVSLSRTVNLLTASEDRNTHRAMMMDSLMMILLEKIDEMEKKNNG